jgi:hypothetical protein
VRRVAIIVGMTAVALVAAAAVLFARGSEEFDCSAFRFDAAAWKDSSGNPSPRRPQADGIAACGTLNGKTRTQVRRALGPADDRDADGVAYEVGPDSLGIDSMFLDVHFRHSRVTRATLYQG